MDPLLAAALALPFAGDWRKRLTAGAFALALVTSALSNYLAASFFFGFSLLTLWLSDWEQAKYPLFFLAMFDLVGILTSTNLLELFLYFELAIYASYFLVSDGDMRAVFRYFVVNSVGSALMLFALASSFLQTGSLAALTPGGTAIFALGLLVKLGMAPFQDWLVDIYRDATLAPKLFFSAILTEISPLALLLVVQRPSPALQAFSMVSMLAANLMSLTEDSMPRLLALFDASNLAYDLLAIAVATPGSRAAALYMTLAHVVAMAFAWFALELSQSRTLGDLKAPLGLELPFYASFFALSGLPPFHLFPGKLLLFESVFSASHPLSYFLLFNLALGAFASLRVLASVKGSRKVRVKREFRAVLYGLLALSLAAGLLPHLFFRLSSTQLALLG